MADAEPYLVRLTTRLLNGIEWVDPKRIQRTASYLRSIQNPDGGFSGRSGSSDLYYTGFALRSLALLGQLDEELSRRAARFLGSHQPGRLTSAIDLFSLLVSARLVLAGGGPDLIEGTNQGTNQDWIHQSEALLNRLRTPDGGYAKLVGQITGSTYASFLAAMCYELIGVSLPEPERLQRFIRSRRRSDGGYVEIAAMKRGGTNPTAAAVGLLQILGAWEKEETTATLGFIEATRSPWEQSYRATTRAPAADLLSTFTACWTIDQLGATGNIDWPGIMDYLRNCEGPKGGFRGGLWDDQVDVEYTFYGLGTACLAAAAHRSK